MGIENPIHLLFLGLVALLVLGPKRLPDVARAAGKGLREFREVLGGGADGTGPAGLGSLLSTITEAQPPAAAQPAAASQSQATMPAPPPAAMDDPSGADHQGQAPAEQP